MYMIQRVIGRGSAILYDPDSAKGMSGYSRHRRLTSPDKPFASVAKGRWFESYRAYQIPHIERAIQEGDAIDTL